MNETKFTPGPWQMGHSYSVENADHEVVATCANVNLGSGKCFANARLISSAPDLYAACEAIDQLWNKSAGPNHNELISAMKMAAAALRKARGDEPR